MQMARAFGDGPKAPLPKGLVSKEEPAPPPKPKVRARKRVTHRDGMGQFVDKKGVPLLTNRIVKYRIDSFARTEFKLGFINLMGGGLQCS